MMEERSAIEGGANAEAAALNGPGAPEPGQPAKRPSAWGVARGGLSSVDDFLRRKHEEIDEEERRYDERRAAAMFRAASQGAEKSAVRLVDDAPVDGVAPSGSGSNEPGAPAARGSGFGKYRDVLSSADDFLRRKHEEIEDEERRYGERQAAAMIHARPEDAAEAAVVPGEPGPAVRRANAFGKFRGLLPTVDEFLSRKHAELDEEERRGR